MVSDEKGLPDSFGPKTGRNIKGTARLTIEGHGERSSRVRLVSSLVPVNPLLRSAAVLARPAIGWGHDWVLDHGLTQFVRHTSL